MAWELIHRQPGVYRGFPTHVRKPLKHHRHIWLDLCPVSGSQNDTFKPGWTCYGTSCLSWVRSSRICRTAINVCFIDVRMFACANVIVFVTGSRDAEAGWSVGRHVLDSLWPYFHYPCMDFLGPMGMIYNHFFQPFIVCRHLVKIAPLNNTSQ